MRIVEVMSIEDPTKCDAFEEGGNCVEPLMQLEVLITEDTHQSRLVFPDTGEVFLVIPNEENSSGLVTSLFPLRESLIKLFRGLPKIPHGNASGIQIIFDPHTLSFKCVIVLGERGEVPPIPQTDDDIGPAVND